MRGYDLKNVCLLFWLSERIAFQVNLEKFTLEA